MTLFKQIVIIIAFFQTLIFGIVLWQNFNTINQFVQTQLAIDAGHTANSLGLSITPAAIDNDVVLMETMIASMFDSGYYELISLKDINDKVLVKKYLEPKMPGVPKWFTSMIKMEAPTASSNIMAGWNQFGILEVKNNIGAAYIQLYDTFKDIATTFLLVTMLSFSVLYLSLKFILAPLTKVRQQAEALLNNDFIFQKKLPMTEELKEVVRAMNTMVEKVKSIFEKEADSVKKYHELLYKDEESELFNRRYFVLSLEDRLKSEAHSAGSVVFFTLASQNELKSDIGYEKSKKLYESIGKCTAIIGKYDENKVLSRMKDSDFALLLPNIMPSKAVEICRDLQEKLHENIKSLGLDENKYFFNFGIVSYNEQMKISDIFSKADYALTASKSKGFPDIIIHEGNEDIILGREAWRKEIENAIEDKRFVFASQKVIDSHQDIYHHELFLRLKDRKGKIKSAGYFMPMINELNMYDAVDKYVLDRAGEFLKTQPQISLAINIGKEMMINAFSLSWFKKSIEKLSKVKEGTVSFETYLRQGASTEIISSFSKMLRSLNYNFGLDNFSLDGDSLKVLQDINPNYIKIQSTMILDLLEGENGIMTEQSLKIITESMDIKIIATGIENEDEKNRLEKLGIKYFQGSLIQEPKLIDKNLE